MTIVDLTGKAITELLTNAGVMAIVGQQVRPEFAAGESPPAVIVEALGIDYRLGAGTRRLGIQVPTFVARCYGGSRVQASQLANAVVEAVNARGTRRDAGGRLVYGSLVESGGDVELDPITHWPFATVVFTFVGSQIAVS